MPQSPLDLRLFLNLAYSSVLFYPVDMGHPFTKRAGYRNLLFGSFHVIIDRHLERLKHHPASYYLFENTRSMLVIDLTCHLN